MSDFLASEVSVEEEPAAVRQVPSLATAVLGANGVTLKGPTDLSVLSNGYDEWEKVFGGHIASSASSLFVKMFFENGGVELHFVRTVHHTDSSDPTSKTSTKAQVDMLTGASSASAGSITSSNTGPYDIEPGDTVTVVVDGGSPATATFTAVAATQITTNSQTSPYALANADVLTVKIDGQAVAQSITFLTANFVTIATATALEVAAVINAQLVGGKATVSGSPAKVTITSDKRGTGSHVEVTGGTANAAGKLNFPTAPTNGTGNVANIDQTTVAEAITVIQAAVAGCTVTNVGGATKISSNTTGGSSSILVQAASTADDEFGFDNATHTGASGASVATLRVFGKYDGTFANNIRAIIEAATSGDATRFNLKVEYNGSIVERFPDLSMADTDAKYVEKVINDAGIGSSWISVTDLDAGAAPGDRPANATSAFLTGGGDGLVGLADTDFVGGSGANGDVGLRALDDVQGLTLVAVPGRATSAVHNGMITYCEIVREGLCFAVLDPPQGLSAAGIVSYVQTTAAIQRLSEYAAIYWPNVLISNPNKTVFGNTDTIVAPPSGAIAGLYSRIDAQSPSGVFVHPAGVDNGKLFNIAGLEMPEVKKIAKRKIVFPQLINPISTEPGEPIFVDGARTLKDNGSWPTIGERRGIIFIETTLKQGLTFMRHRNINDRLFNEGKQTVTAFMVQQTKNEAFASTKPSEAFTIDFGKGLNPPSAAFNKRVYSRLSVATAKPGEFIVLKVTPDQRALLAELAAA